jgi:Ribonuclease G/E
VTIEILLARTGGESRGAVLTDGVLTDYRAGRGKSRVGGVYRARVKKIVPGLAGGVVEIPGGEAWLDFARTKGAKPREGATVTIQIVQEAQGGKLARAAAEPLIAGRFLALQTA